MGRGRSAQGSRSRCRSANHLLQPPGSDGGGSARFPGTGDGGDLLQSDLGVSKGFSKTWIPPAWERKTDADAVRIVENVIRGRRLVVDAVNGFYKTDGVTLNFSKFEPRRRDANLEASRCHELGSRCRAQPAPVARFRPPAAGEQIQNLLRRSHQPAHHDLPGYERRDDACLPRR